MADAPAPAASGISSTPTDSTTAPVAAAAPVAATAAFASDTTTTASTAPSASAETTAAPAATQEAPPAQPLFTVPDDLKLNPEATTQFESFLKSKLTPEGKVLLTGQEVFDHYATQARAANARWQQQIADANAKNEAECRARFTPAQLAASETAVGFFSSFDPAFRDFAKGQLNNPVFVNAMRTVGERLSEDTFEIGGQAPPPAPKKSAAERMGYARPRTN
jgi:hypothetical protein